MSTNMHGALINEWFSSQPPTHYFHNGAGMGWYIFRTGERYLVMLDDFDNDETRLKAVLIADSYSELTDLYNTVKAQHPNAKWLH